jgi:hypothetical protein
MGLWQEVFFWESPTMGEPYAYESYVNIQEGFGYIGVTLRKKLKWSAGKTAPCLQSYANRNAVIMQGYGSRFAHGLGFRSYAMTMQGMGDGAR